MVYKYCYFDTSCPLHSLYIYIYIFELEKLQLKLVCLVSHRTFNETCLNIYIYIYIVIIPIGPSCPTAFGVYLIDRFEQTSHYISH